MLMRFNVPIGLEAPDTHVLGWCTFCLALGSGFWAVFVVQVVYQCTVLNLQDATQ